MKQKNKTKIEKFDFILAVSLLVWGIIGLYVMFKISISPAVDFYLFFNNLFFVIIGIVGICNSIESY